MLRGGLAGPRPERLSGTIFRPALRQRASGTNTTPPDWAGWARITARFPLARRSFRKVYGRLGDLEVRLAVSTRDLHLVQRLRYRVFYEEMSAVADDVATRRRRDVDAFDDICDHLLVLDHGAPRRATSGRHFKPMRVVGTYRLLRQSVAEATRGFYTQAEFDIAPLLTRKHDYTFLELGRSCVLEPYRNKRTVELLWHGLWTYAREHGIDVMIGCASFEGTDPDAHAMALSFLYHTALAPADWRVRAHDAAFRPMNSIAKDQLDLKAALKAIPPLIKGYLRLGAYVGDGAVVDPQFRTTDVCIILPVEKIDPRYFAHFGQPEEKGSRVAR